MAVRGPPGGVGEDGRPMLAPEAAAGEFAGDAGRGEDYQSHQMLAAHCLVVVDRDPMPRSRCCAQSNGSCDVDRVTLDTRGAEGRHRDVASRNHRSGVTVWLGNMHTILKI